MQGQRNIIHTIPGMLQVETSWNNMNNEPNMYPSNRTSMLAATNMQGYINSANAASHAGSIYAHDLMAAAASSAEHVTVQACANEDKMINNWNLGSSMPSTLRFDGLQLMDTNVLPSENSIGNNLNYGLVSDGIPYNTSQALAGGFCPHPILRSGSEVERIPSTGSGVRGSAESNFGRANHFTSGGRGSCKRKSMEYISGHSSYDGPLQSFNRDGGSSSRFTVPLRHDIGSSSRFPTPAVTPGGVRYWEESAIPRPSLMSGASMNSDYRCSSVSMTGAVDGSQRSVRSRPNTSHHHEPNLRHLQPSGNSGWYLHPRSLSSVEQPASADLAGASTSSILREPSQFPVPSSFQRRGLIPDGWNENMPRVGSHFSSTVSGREWPSSLHDETSSNSMIVGDPNQVWPVAGSQNRVLNNDLAIWTPMNRNMNGIAHTAQMCGNLMLNQRTTVPWHRPQNSLMQATRTNSGTAQGSISASRPGQSNHFPRQAGPVRFGPLMDMALHPAGGFQGSHYLRSSLLEHRGEQDVRPHVRSILDVSFERLQTLPNDGAGHNRLMPEIVNVLEHVRRGDNLRFEDVLMLDRSAFYGAADLPDQHRDMRLDVENMSYEELLALGEQIGNVSTGLTEDSISKCLKKSTYSSCRESSATDEESQKCSICQEEYKDNEELGILECGHNHHTECIKKWLMQKNECPICKASAFKT